jgi:hypothetical protein
MLPVRIFISSPGDVQLERQIARRVILRLQGEFTGAIEIEPFFWEYEPMRLTRDFQSQIPPTSSFDIVVCILWSRLGTRLGPQHHRADGTPFQSGTEFEFEDAANSYLARGAPDILVYHNRTDPPIKPRPKAERERQLAQFDALEAFLDRWTRDSDVLKGALTTYADLGQFEERLTEHLRKLIKARRPDDSQTRRVERPHATWTAGSPFRGLEPFEFEHAPVFRGRTRAVQDVIGLLRQQYTARQAGPPDGVDHEVRPSFVLVSAMSGIGKSSLVRAGVLPFLTEPGVIEAVGLWRRAVMKPLGGTVALFDALAAALSAPEALPELLADGTSVQRLAQLLRESPASLDPLVKGGLSQAAATLVATEEAQLRQWQTEFLAQGRAADAEQCRQQVAALTQHQAALVLFVDQLEEVFTADEQTGGAERDAFLTALDSLARSGRAMVIATLRSDFLARAAEMPTLASLMHDGALYQLEPPTLSELAQIIRDPAREAALTFEQDQENEARLDDLLLSALQGDPAALPLLEFTLDQLYQRRDPSGLLTHSAYRELGGVEGAVAKRAEEEFAALGPAAQASFGRLFGTLVNLHALYDEERPVRRRAAMSQFAAQPAVTEFIDRFARARLFVLDQGVSRQRSVSVVHESLFSHWDRLRVWIQENRDLLRVRARIEVEAARWQSEGRPRDLLLSSGRLLAEAQELVVHHDVVALSDPVPTFIEQSVTAENARRRRRSAALAVLAAALAVAAVISWYQVQSLNHNRVESKLLEYRRTVREARDLFLTQTPARQSQENALGAAMRVLELQNEVRALQGSPPEGAEADAAQVYEYTGMIRAALGDANGSLGDLQKRSAILEASPELKQTVPSIRAASPYAFTVLDILFDLFIAEQHQQVLLWQKELLRQALAERTGGSAFANAAAAEKPDPQQLLAGYQHFAILFDYLTRESPRAHDFKNLRAVQQLQASVYQGLDDLDTAERKWQDRVASARRELDWARSATIVDEKEHTVAAAAQAILQAQKELTQFNLNQRRFPQALGAARQQLEIFATIPEVDPTSADRFEAQQDIAAALTGLGQPEAAAREVEIGAAALLGAARDVRATRYRQVATARAKLGTYAGALEADQQSVAVLKPRADSGESPAAPRALVNAYLGLSWHAVLARQFREAATASEKGLVLATSDEERAFLSTNLAHALLFQGFVDQARDVYETWKTKPVAVAKAGQERPTLFADAVLEDFDELQRIGLTHPAMPAIQASMRAASKTD